MAKVMVARNEGIVVGVDTHRDVHVAVALSGVGANLGTTSVPTTVAGSSELLRWAQALGPIVAFGIEGTGSALRSAMVRPTAPLLRGHRAQEKRAVLEDTLW